jgi:hypothetical protein
MQLKNVFARKNLLAVWAVVGPLIGIVVGQAWWESGKLNLDTIRTTIEVREKMTRMLQEIETIDGSKLLCC